MNAPAIKFAPSTDKARTAAALFALYFIWGSTYLAIRLALPGFPPLMMSGLRFVIAGGLLYLLLRLREESQSRLFATNASRLRSRKGCWKPKLRRSRAALPP